MEKKSCKGCIHTLGLALNIHCSNCERNKNFTDRYVEQSTKVKKWRWVYSDSSFRLFITDNYYTEEEVAEKVYSPIEKIDSTEKEF
jgi:hypothetical protein